MRSSPKDDAGRYPEIVLPPGTKKCWRVVSLDHSHRDSLIDANVQAAAQRHGERSRVVVGVHVARWANVCSEAPEERDSEQRLRKRLHVLFVTCSQLQTAEHEIL